LEIVKPEKMNTRIAVAKDGDIVKGLSTVCLLVS